MSLDIIHNTLFTPMFSNADMSVNASVVQVVQGITVYCIQVGWATFNQDAAARITVSASNDGILYTQIDSITPTSASNTYMLNVEKCGYRFVKLAYTQSAATGVLNATISGKII